MHYTYLVLKHHEFLQFCFVKYQFGLLAVYLFHIGFQIESAIRYLIRKLLLFVKSSNRLLLTLEYICNTFVLYVFIALFQFFNCSFQFLARLLKYVPIRIEKF